MSRKPSLSARYSLARIRVRRDGTDATGAYWGAGPDVFVATSADGNDEVTVRARSVKEARAAVDAELARCPGEPRAQRALLGGTAPRKTRYEITWTNPVDGRPVRIRITHARDYLASGTDHIEVESIHPKKAPLPITETGYRSHFLPPLDLMNAGGPVTFVTAWIEQEARGKSWLKTAAVAAQGDLFAWAETQTEVGNRKRAPKVRSARPKPPVATRKPRRGARVDNS
jgi:hypothetical protein